MLVTTCVWVLTGINHSLTFHFKNQRRVDLLLNSHQPGAKPLRANGDLVHIDMLVPQRRVMKPAAPLFSSARHAAKVTAFYLILLYYAKWRKGVQRKRKSGCWSKYNWVSGLLIRWGVVEALVPVKGADVGQALPPHKYQGQGWLEKKVA